MFDKEYVLRNLYQIVCLEIPSEDEWVEFGLQYFSSWYYEDLKNVISATREIERSKQHYINMFHIWKGGENK